MDHKNDEKETFTPAMAEADNWQFDAKPRRKADAQVAGRLSVWKEEGAYYFDAAKARPEMKREVVLDRAGVKLSRTAGAKENSYILTAKCRGDAADPAGELLNKCYEQLKDKARKVPAFSPKSFLLDREGEIKIWRNKAKRQLNVFITLDESKEKEIMLVELLSRMQETNKMIVSLKK